MPQFFLCTAKKSNQPGIPKHMFTYVLTSHLTLVVSTCQTNPPKQGLNSRRRKTNVFVNIKEIVIRDDLIDVLEI